MKSKAKKSFTAGIITVVILSVCLLLTSAALAWATVSMEGNVFVTGTVSVDLNGGAPVIEDDEFLFEPGMTVKKEFYIENNSGCEVWYRLYFSGVSGQLADVLEITVSDTEDAVLYSGKVSELTAAESNMPEVTDKALGIGEKRTLYMTFHYPEESERIADSPYLVFNLVCDAVQAKNNPEKEF